MPLKLIEYMPFVKKELSHFPDLSAAQIKEYFPIHFGCTKGQSKEYIESPLGKPNRIIYSLFPFEDGSELTPTTSPNKLFQCQSILLWLATVVKSFGNAG